MKTSSGETYPWLNAHALRVIDSWKGINDWSVFEYGSGESTFWWAKRCRRVISVESVDRFYQKMVLKLTTFKNVEYRLRELIVCKDCKYVQSINEDDKCYDLIIIDGRNRVLCSYEVAKHLKPNTVVIFDNTDRPDYDEGVALFDKKLLPLGYAKFKSPHTGNKKDVDLWWETIIWMPKGFSYDEA